MQHLVHMMPGHGQKFFSGVAREPAGECQGRLTGRELQLWIFAAPGASHYIPTVARGGRGVDDENSFRAMPRGLLVFIGPAAVVGERAASEEFWVVGRRLVGEQDQHFAFHVHALEVVPVKFRCHDAVADEDGFGVELIRGLLEFADANVVVQPSKSDLLIVGYRRKRGARLSGGAHHRHALKECPIFSSWFGASRCELSCDIFGGQLFAASSHATAFQLIAREILHVGSHAVARRVRAIGGKDCGRKQQNR